MTKVDLVAPIAGWLSRLSEVPDPVFADAMMGDGVAIDPIEGVLRAPCDATVIAVAPTAHAITLALANGAELLIHIGIDTVGLAGNGFTPLVADGQAVKSGDPLIEIDLDIVARGARSLVTPIVITNDGFGIEPAAVDRRVAAGDPIFSVVGTGSSEILAPVGSDTATCQVVVPLANGIHARPAARIVAALRPYAADVRVTANGKTMNARSTVGLMTLGVRHDDTLTIEATGADARVAVTTIGALIEGGMGEANESPALPRPVRASSSGTLLHGVCAAPGLAVGAAAILRANEIEVAETGRGPSIERAALDDALARLSNALNEPSGHAEGIAAAHRALLDDPVLVEAAHAAIAAGKSAGHAWRQASEAQAEALRATGEPLLIERVADLLDIERQLLARLHPDQAPKPPTIPPGAILIADELLPSEFMRLDAGAIAGICTARGGPTSHVAILAASAGIPMLVAASEGVLAIDDGATVILDAGAGSIDTDPSADALTAARAAIDASTARGLADRAAAATDCVMADGTRVEIFANLGSAADAAFAVAAGAEGCGLLRTEFLFLDRTAAPDEEEQRAAYAAIAAALGGRPLIVRTLDIGGDKPVPYLPFPHEDNPALGARGVRLSLARPDLLVTQFRAILRAVPASRCRIMIPMIVDRDDYRAVRTIFEAAKRDVGIDAPIPLGVMIETPAAALLAATIGADFLSIGTNDLTQYALATDRGNPALASRIDALHPAVLRLIAVASEGTRADGCWLGVCGGLASDPRAAAILIGLGVTELSAASAAIPALKATVRALRFDDCRALARRALACATAQEVRALLEETA